MHRFSLVARRPRSVERYSQVTVLNAWQGKFLRAVADAGMITTNGSLASLLPAHSTTSWFISSSRLFLKEPGSL